MIAKNVSILKKKCTMYNGVIYYYYFFVTAIHSILGFSAQYTILHTDTQVPTTKMFFSIVNFCAAFA